jgi:uncharacterized protein
MHTNPADEQVRQILTDTHTIAIVGASRNPERASHGIMRKLQRSGYRVIPVNPNETEVLGEKAYASLSDISEPVDIVNVFRRAEYTPPIAAEAVSIGAKVLWLQSGISNEEAAERATAGGLTVVMDECLGTMHSILRIANRHR